jgi:3',5'-cyclic AMP phosphodiesterase CpdA
MGRDRAGPHPIPRVVGPFPRLSVGQQPIRPLPRAPREKAAFEGTIRRDPVDKETIVVGSLSCNSNHDRGDRDSIVRNLLAQDPDLLFFAGDQSYDHAQHTAAWLLWGKQFREVLRDRPVITIPDDHDIGQPNFWGEGGIVADSELPATPAAISIRPTM